MRLLDRRRRPQRRLRPQEQVALSGARAARVSRDVSNSPRGRTWLISGPSYTTKWTGTGNNKTITADGPTGQWSAKKENITVVGVKKVVRVEGTTQTDGPLIVPVGTSVSFKALRDPGDAMVEQTGPFPADWPKWSFKKSTDVNDQQLESETGSRQISFSRTEPGEYIVKAQCGTSSGTFTVTFVGVEKVIVDGSDPEIPEDDGPVRIPRGSMLTLRAKPAPSGAAFPAGNPTWAIQSKPPLAPLTDPDSGETVELTFLVAGEYVIAASCGTSTKTIKISAVGISKILVDGEAPTSLAVDSCQGTEVELEAVPDLDTADFPEEMPVWTVEQKPTGSAVPNSLGTGATKNVTLDKAGTYVFKAQCGDSQKVVILQVTGVASVDESALVACVNGTPITLTAVPALPEAALPCLEWEYRLNGGGWAGVSGSGLTTTLPLDWTPGTYRFRARNGSAADWVESEDLLLIGLDSVVAMEMHGSGGTRNIVGVNAGEEGKMWLSVPAGDTSRSVKFTPAPIQAAAARTHILYTVDGTGASPASGNFSSGSAQISFQDGIFSTVSIGCDANLDGTLQSGERMITVYIKTINFTSSAYIVDHRTSTPAEEPFPVVSGEHQEVGGTFQFALTGSNGANSSNSLARYQVWSLPVLDNNIIQEGKGLSFSHTWTTGLDEGPVSVYFFGDCDDNEFCGTQDPAKVTGIFYVMQKKVYNLDVRYSSALGTLTQAEVQANFDTQVERVFKRDAAEDYRACIDILIKDSFGPFSPNTTTAPDPCIDQDDRDIHYANPLYEVSLLDNIGALIFKPHVLRGQVSQKYPNRMLIDWNDMSADTFIHEFGHTRGLGHNSSPNYIMCAGGKRNAPAFFLFSTEAKAYDAGP